MLGVVAPARAAVAPPLNEEPYVVFTIGDSYAAGEGAPEVPGAYNINGDRRSVRPARGLGRKPRQRHAGGHRDASAATAPRSRPAVSPSATWWTTSPTSRSSSSPSRAAAARSSQGAQLDRDDPVNGNANPKPEPGGVLRSYSGEDFLEDFDPRPQTPPFPPAAESDRRPPQCRRRCRSTALDALVVGIGGNDAGFASYVAACTDVPFQCSPGRQLPPGLHADRLRGRAPRSS